MTGAYLKEYELELLGRNRIYTDVDEITVDNIFEVLSEAITIHEINMQEILYLLRYEKGIQPLVREKTIRDDIDIKVSDNLANQIVEFKLGYNYGNPITYVQRGNQDIAGNPPDGDDNAISQLNEMNDAEAAYAKDQETLRFVQVCGIGHQMVDVKRTFDGVSVFDLHVPHPLYTFVVYKNDIAETPMMGVTFRQLGNGDRYFTCYTKDVMYEVKNLGQIVNGQWVERTQWGFDSNYVGYAGEENPLGAIPIVEFVRSYDRMGVFERQISMMDSLNVEVSDFANAAAQSCQEIWWGNDFEFPVDPKTGNVIKPKTGGWLLTKTLANGKSPLIQAITSTFDFENVQKNIESKRNSILQKCYVPLQSDPGGGSTGSAMSLSSGWTAAENSAMREEQVIRRSKQKILELELAAVSVRENWIAGSPLVDLKPSDVYIKFTRQKTYDLGTKTNAMVAMIKAGVNGRVAMQTVDLFADVAQAWADSKDTIERYQESIVTKREDVNIEEKRETADLTDQTGNSPILDGMNMNESGGDDDGNT